MEFCDICDNMLYIKDHEGTGLMKYCKHCGFEKIIGQSGSALKISETIYSEDDLLYMQYQNKYLRHDPTLPRVRDPNLTCPNDACSGPRDEPQVLYVKYHPVHMKYFYCCDYCGFTWRSDDYKK
jgi:DNA-directed RNA polymerase subunit M/transcription elongation factor TFIIS